MNVADQLTRHAQETPHAVAVIDQDRITRYRALEQAVWRASAWLREQGLQPGDTVALAMGSSALHLVAGLALARMGAVQLPLAPSEGQPLCERLCARHRVAAIVTDEETGFAVPGTRSLPADAAWLERGAPAGNPDLRAPGGNAHWMAVRTSGTTGAPKTVLQSHATYAARRALARGDWSLQQQDRYLAVMPLGFHLGYKMCLDALWVGASVVIPGTLPRASDFFDAVDRHRASYLYLPAKQLHSLLPALRPGKPRLPALRVLRSGSMALPEQLRLAVSAGLSPNLVLSYGVNDLDCGVTQADPGVQARFPGSVGLPRPGVELQVVDESQRPLPAGEVGEVRVRIPDMPSGYHEDPAATAAAFREGWFYPGDLALQSAEGALYLKGRRDDMMNFDGIKIFPADIEAALLEHPAVAEAAALGVQADAHQHVPAAAVVLRQPVAMEALLGWCRERLGSRAPQMIAPVASLPRGGGGKVLKQELAALFAHRLK
jgi:acyl-coenzyme A synthetase/AMP-(fatty) acid ligase